MTSLNHFHRFSGVDSKAPCPEAATTANMGLPIGALFLSQEEKLLDSHMDVYSEA